MQEQEVKCKACNACLKATDKFCGECGAVVEAEECSSVENTEIKKDAIVDNSVSKKDLSDMAEKAKGIASELAKEATVKGVKGTKAIASEFKAFDYSTLKSKAGWLSFIKNKKRVGALIALVLLITLVCSFSSGSDKEDLVMAAAEYQMQEQTYSAADETVYDLKIEAKDGKGRYIVTGTMLDAKDFETWWVVWVEVYDDNEHYNIEANYHGASGMTEEQWINKYKTDPAYRWGEAKAEYN